MLIIAVSVVIVSTLAQPHSHCRRVLRHEKIRVHQDLVPFCEHQSALLVPSDTFTHLMQMHEAYCTALSLLREWIGAERSTESKGISLQFSVPCRSSEGTCRRSPETEEET